MKSNNDATTTEANTNNYNNNNSSSFGPENNPLYKAVIPGIAGSAKIYFETVDKAIFE